MTREIESRLAKVLACKKNGGEKQWSKAYDWTMQIGDFGKKKKFRGEAVAALKAIVAHGFVDDVAWMHLSDLVTADDVEYVRSHLREERATYNCMAALIRLYGREAYAEAVEIVCDGRHSGNTRLSVLQVLAEHSGYPFDELVAEYESLEDIDDADLPVAELRQWQAGGFAKYVEPKIELPAKQLKKAGIELPDDYQQFLLKHRGRDRLEFDDAEWDLTTAGQMFEPVKINGKEYPGIGVLKGFAAAMRDACPDGQTTDAKGKPFPLSRLAAGVAIGSSDAGDVLFLDPAEGYSVWVFHHDGGDVEQVGKSFAAWKRKTSKAD